VHRIQVSQWKKQASWKRPVSLFAKGKKAQGKDESQAKEALDVFQQIMASSQDELEWLKKKSHCSLGDFFGGPPVGELRGKKRGLGSITNQPRNSRSAVTCELLGLPRIHALY